MNNSYYFYWEGQWYWSRNQRSWSKPNDGKRYPAVNIVILTKGSYEYAWGEQTVTEPPQDSSPDRDRVIVIKDMKQWESHWDQAAPYNKLLVYEFYEKNNSLCKAMDKPFEKLANRYKGKADFCKLDVDNLEFLAGLCGVEGAYPTFVLFKNFKQVGKVVGIKEDELERSIQRNLSRDVEYYD
ncbi:thioredoxin-1-like [Miscanthus floridulus]|uniref:thioredoxin-1-like n=1 Tax=Miscanthus floridulus TaxID=154761 RepID=UPI0034577CAD